MASKQKPESFELNGFKSPSGKTDDEESSGKSESPISIAKQSSIEPEKAPGFRSLFKYPPGTYFCLGNEFSERFSFYGMRAVLTMYLITAHGLSSTQAKLIFHAFVFTAYFTPIFGSILADGFLGRYRVILSVSIVYCLGHVLLTVSAIPNLGTHIIAWLDYTGLFVIALATGGIKPCVSAFAADQFPENRAAERTQFFSFFYFSINLGALMSQILTPILRTQPCLGNDTCFPLAFGIPAGFMFIATFVFLAGTPFYKITRYRDNIIWRVLQCIVYAIREKFRNRQQKKSHWLDYAAPKFDRILIEDVKTLLNIMLLFFPVILFWALFEQQGSTWVIQASQMNGRIGKLTILPDQMGVLNPFLVIILVPIFEGIIYPILSKCNIWTTQLRRMGSGGFLAAVSFIMAGFLQLALDKTAIGLPSQGQSRVMIINNLNCNISVIGTINFTVAKGNTEERDLDNITTITPIGHSCGPWSDGIPYNIPNNPGFGHVLALFDRNPNLGLPAVQYEVKKTEGGKTRLYFLFESMEVYNLTVTLEQDGIVKKLMMYNETNMNGSQYIDVEPDGIGSNEYEIYTTICGQNGEEEKCEKTLLKTFFADSGAAYAITVPAKGRSDSTSRIFELIKPNSVSIMWQIPQYVIITIGEILFSISGLAFSYSQASPKMKSVFQALWLLTSAFGNLIDMGLSGSGLFENKPALEFFVYGSIMGIIMILFVVLAWRYKHTKRGSD